MIKRERFWLTPPEVYAELNKEFSLDFDPCPNPLPAGFNGLAVEWGKSNYVNPPFRKSDAVYGGGPTSFARKAVEENKKGNTVVLLLPVVSYVDILLKAGAEIRPMGRVPWLEVETKIPYSKGGTIACFILRGNNERLRR